MAKTTAGQGRARVAEHAEANTSTEDRSRGGRSEDRGEGQTKNNNDNKNNNDDGGKKAEDDGDLRHPGMHRHRACTGHLYLP